MAENSLIDVRLVKTKSDLKLFISFVAGLYKDDPNWVHPLNMERMEALSPNKNPFFNHAEVAMWIAFQDDKPVGRISAQVDELTNQIVNPKLGHFGLFECINDQTVAHALFETAKKWLKERGMSEMSGPFDLSINEMCGLLVEGFDEPPMIMMGHHRPYYQTLLLGEGFAKEKDLLAYMVSTYVPWPDKFLRIIEMAKRNKNIRIRELNMRKYNQEIETVFDIFNDAWSGNWGFVPFTKEEAKHTAKELRPVIRPHRAMIAEYKGKEVAFMITVPDVNGYIRDLKGKLLPFGWLKLIWRILRNNETSVRTPLLGIRKEIQNTPYGGLLAILLIDSIRQNIIKNKGARRAELSWILEDNTSMRNILEQAGSKIYKIYRIFHRAI